MSYDRKHVKSVKINSSTVNLMRDERDNEV